MPSSDQLKLARRVLKVIEDHGHPSHADAFALRLLAEPRIRLSPLEEIAKEIHKAAHENTSG